MVDAMAVRDDDRRTVVRFRFAERLDDLVHVRAHRDAGNVHVAIAHGDHAEVFFARGLSACCKLRDGSNRGRLGHLSTGVRIDFGVEDEEVNVAAGSDDVVKAAEADVVCPSVAADDPDGAVDEVIAERDEFSRISVLRFCESGFKRFDVLALSCDRSVFGRGVGEDRVDFGDCDSLALYGGSDFACVDGELVARQAHAEAEFRSILEEGVGPGRAFSIGGFRVRGRREVSSVDRRTTGRVRNDRAVAEELREKLDVRGFTATGASTGELEERALHGEELGVAQVELCRFRIGKFLEEEVPVGCLGCAMLGEALQVDRLDGGIFLVLGGHCCTQSPQPVQSSAEAWMVNFQPSNSLVL